MNQSIISTGISKLSKLRKFPALTNKAKELELIEDQKLKELQMNEL